MSGAGNNVYNQATTWGQNAANTYQDSMAYKPMQFNQGNLQPFMNPYTQNVIDNTMATMDEARANAINANQLAASNSSAYGGSRHGIADAQIGQNYMKAVGDMSANLNQQGYNNAVNQFNTMNAANLSGLNQNMSGANNLANLGMSAWNAGQAMDDKAWQQGMYEQAMNQKLLDAAKGQFSSWANQPATNLGFLSTILGGLPNAETSTTTKQSGIFDWLTSPFLTGPNSVWGWGS